MTTSTWEPGAFFRTAWAAVYGEACESPSWIGPNNVEMLLGEMLIGFADREKGYGRQVCACCELTLNGEVHLCETCIGSYEPDDISCPHRPEAPR